MHNKSFGHALLVRDENQWHEMRIPRHPCSRSERAKLVSLNNVMTPAVMKCKPRSKIGLQLASMVMQLYGTAWLRDTWGAEDVLFLKQEDGNILFDYPLIQRPVQPLNNSPFPLASKDLPIVMNDPRLFALGMLLIELYYGEPIDRLKTEDMEYQHVRVNDSDVSLLTLPSTRHQSVLFLSDEDSVAVQYRKGLLTLIRLLKLDI